MTLERAYGGYLQNALSRNQGLMGQGTTQWSILYSWYLEFPKPTQLLGILPTFRGVKHPSRGACFQNQAKSLQFNQGVP
jgi:hypothetical protein